MVNWPFLKRKEASRVALKLKRSAFQCLTDSTVSSLYTLIAGSIPRKSQTGKSAPASPVSIPSIYRKLIAPMTKPEAAVNGSKCLSSFLPRANPGSAPRGGSAEGFAFRPKQGNARPNGRQCVGSLERDHARHCPC